ncbi:MAG: helix-turn-helix domain-containing protein [Lachnospiraceae bacterium]|nr:helix-turn-helix domain-containing protein [Lachnospiraceae bacterium]
MEADYLAIGKRIKQLRREQNMSQERLALQIEVSIPHMSNIENGKTKFSLPVLISLADALDVTPDALLVGLDGGNVERGRFIREIAGQLADCNEGQMELLMEMFISFKKLLQRYEECVTQQEEGIELSDLI